MFFIFFIPKFLCSYKMISVSGIIQGNIITKTSLYCSKSPNGSTDLFYKIGDINYQIKYDEKDDFVEKIKLEKTIQKFEYLNSEKEYIMLTTRITYINNNNDSKGYLYGNDDFFILSNKDCITLKHIFSFKEFQYYLEIYYNFYPFDSDNFIQYTLDDAFIRYYEIIETSDSVLFFLLLDTKPNSYTLDIYALNIKNKTLEKTETLYKDILGFTLIDLNNRKTNNFIYCISESFESKCYIAKYENRKIISDKYIIVFDFQCILKRELKEFKKNYALLKDGKIAIICSSSQHAQLTIFEYKNNSLKIDEVFHREIMNYDYDNKISNLFLIYNTYKGLILYNMKENSKNYNFTFSAYKTYFEEVCSSFNMITDKFQVTNISFINHIFGGNVNTQPNFYITEIDPKIYLYNKYNETVKPGITLYNSNDSFTFVAEFSETPLIIKFRNANYQYTCNARIDIFYYKIEILDRSYRCDINPESLYVNNITSLDLNKSYDVAKNKYSSFYFNIDFMNYTQEQDLIYKYDNVEFRCFRTSGFYAKSINCLLPDYFNLFPPNKIKYEYNIYSNLSCLNSLYIGTIKIEDPYLLEILDADNLTEISQSMDKTSYNPSEKIEKFSVDMINYYNWFASFPYCDDEFIESGDCCQEEILTDWEIISYKKYYFDYEFLSDYIGFFKLTMKTKIKEIYQLNDEEVDLDIMEPDEIRYAILKSKKFKKYIITFSADNYQHSSFIDKMMLSEMMKFDNNPDILINKYLFLMFNMTINDIFSQKILEEINNNKNYQFIFIGHFIGGALSNLASYYYIKHKLAENEPVLITFGQPRIGNENFARDYMKLIPNVYRIQRYNDMRTMYPPVKKQEDILYIKEIKNIKVLYDFYSNISSIFERREFIRDLFFISKRIVRLEDGIFILNKINSEMKSMIISKLLEIPENIFTEIVNQISSLISYGYCHIGGLYVLNEDINKFYHCRDNYNEDISSHYCKNRDFQYLNDHVIKEENFYFTYKQNPIERCQAFKYGERFLLYP